MARSFHLICNAHLDPVWMWTWEEGAGEALATFRTAAELCEEFEGFVFNHNEAVLYEWVERYEPELFERIQRLVREGRWHIMGGWYLQPDCNMPSGEALVRQIQRGREYFAARFGVRPRTAINFDPFGHSRGLVQLLVQCGYDSYLFGRPTPDALRLPAETFEWRGYDGSRILARRFPAWYSTPLGRAREEVEKRIRECERRGEECAPILWGVGDHGGGPSRKDLQDLTAFLRGEGGVGVRHSTPEAYFAEVRSRRLSVPEVAVSLNPWGVGCYTSQVRVKQQYRALENELFLTEKMVAAAAAQGLMSYPEEALAAAERDMVWSQFHDILPGSSAPEVEEQALRTFGHAREELARVRAEAFFALARGAGKGREDAIPVLVYNPHPYAMEGEVECELQLPDVSFGEEVFDIVVNRGEERVAAQVEQESSNFNAEWRKRVVMRVELPGSQMVRFDCVPVRVKAKGRGGEGREGRYIEVSTGRMRARVDRRTGLLVGYEADGRELLAGPVSFVAYADGDDPWGMAGPVLGGKRLGEFVVMTEQEAALWAGVRGKRLAAVRVIEDGEVRTVVEALLKFRSSRMVVRYYLSKVGVEVGMRCRVVWGEPRLLLRMEFPTQLRNGRFYGQTVFGYEELPQGNRECVAQRWVALLDTEEDVGVTWCGDSGYGWRCRGGRVAWTLLRSPAHAGHPIGRRPITPQDRYTPRIDIGERVFSVWMKGGSCRERLREVEGDALWHNEPPMALAYRPPEVGSDGRPFLLVEPRTVRVVAVKRSRDGRGWIVRIHEPMGEAVCVTVHLPVFGKSYRVELRGFEVKTLKIVGNGEEVREVTPLEEPVSMGR